MESIALASLPTEDEDATCEDQEETAILSNLDSYVTPLPTTSEPQAIATPKAPSSTSKAEK